MLQDAYEDTSPGIAICFFFFSSRRRHTRYWRDWSSDVCSSDLVMSHELRTPLNAIGGYAQLLELGVHGPLNDAQRDALARLARSQTHLLRLINDVLNFAKLDAGQVQYTVADVALDESLASLEPLVAPQVRAKGLTFTWRSSA